MQILQLITFAVAVATASPQVSPPDSIEVVRDVVYAAVPQDPDEPPVQLLLDAAFPKETDGQPLPVVVYIHGGGWVMGNKSDGLPMAVSQGLDRDAAARFAAVASGLIGLAYGAAGRFGGGAVNEVIVEMENAFLFVTGISDGSCLAVVSSADSDVGLVGYEMAVLVDKAGAVLTPELRAELQSALPQ